MKRKIMCLCFCAAGAVGCWGPVELSSTDEDDEFLIMDKYEGILLDPDSGDVSFPVTRKSLYITGVEYPEGIQWQGDVAYDIAGSSLFLMKDGEKIVEIPVGYDNCVSVDADMHRCIDGHLYTDFSTDAETVVKVDGEELFRYSAREMIADMYVKDAKVYTLGIPRSGEGWVFRQNGEILLSRSGGEIVGGLYEDNGVIVFAFMESGTAGEKDKYYVVSNALAATVSVHADSPSVDDLRLIDGTVCYVSRINGLAGEFLFTGDDYTRLETSDRCTMQGDLRLYYDGEDRFVTGSLLDDTGLWREYALETRVAGGIFALALSGSSYLYIIRSETDGFEEICTDGEATAWPDGFDMLYERCAAIDGTDFAVGMLDADSDNRPALWKNGEITEYDFNGPITGLWYQ